MARWHRNRVLKRILRVSSSRVVVLPKEWAEALPEFVWISREGDKIIIIPAEVS